MNRIFIFILIFLNVYTLSAQDFEGELIYESKTNIHIPKEKEFSLKFKSPNKKDKDSIEVQINDSTVYKRLKNKGRLVDSIKVVMANSKIRKTYYQKEKFEYIFDLYSELKITHEPKYECVDTVALELIDYRDRVEVIKSDSIFSINGYNCQKIKIINSNHFFVELYVVESKYRNVSDAFLFDINDNFLFQNLYFLKDFLEFKKIVKLKYYSKQNLVDFEYYLKSTKEKPYSETDFSLPQYEYCFYDLLNDKKLMRKHKRRKRQEKKKMKN